MNQTLFIQSYQSYVKMDTSQFNDIVVSLSYMSMDQLTCLMDEVSILKCIQEEVDYAKKQKTMLHEIQLSFLVEKTDFEKVEKAVADYDGDWVYCEDSELCAVSFKENAPGNLENNIKFFVNMVRAAGANQVELYDVLDIGPANEYKTHTNHKYYKGFFEKNN